MKHSVNVRALAARLVAPTLVVIAMQPTESRAQQAGQDTAWQKEKCALFEQSWAEALESFGSDNINYNFLAQNENFIAGGCTDGTQVCPSSSQEIDIADAITIRLMNAGAASTFLPFRCQTVN